MMIIMIISTMMKKTIIIYDFNHKLAKQRNRERRFDGLRLSPNVSLLLILFLIWINRKQFTAPTWTKYSFCVLSIWIAYICGRLKKVSVDYNRRRYNCTRLQLEPKYQISLFYAFTNGEFRREFRKLLCCRRERSINVPKKAAAFTRNDLVEREEQEANFWA